MPRCYPPDPEFGANRHGERTVWEALQADLPAEAAVFYSRLLVESGREFEIDFLVAWPGVGLAVIEVKGGQVERDSQDRWWSVRGTDRKRIGHPLVQASDARHVLQRHLAEEGIAAARGRIQHLLAFPHMEVPRDRSPADLPRRQVVDKHQLGGIAAVVRDAVKSGDGHQPLDPTGLEELIGRFTQPLGSQSSLLAEAEEHEQRVDQLTRDQAKTLENLRHYRRLAIIGGAGTGKTWLALEQAKRLSKDGQRVALVCYSRGLGRYLQRISATWERKPAYVGLFHDLALDWGAPGPSGDESDYYEQDLPRSLGEIAAEKRPAERFDAIVVDEAQDFGELWWTSLLACLRDPEEGGVYIFLDEDQRVFSRQSEPPISIPPFELRQNIRNTKRIAQVFGSLATNQSLYGSTVGPMVRFVACTTAEAGGRADDAVDALLDDWPGGKIALLTTKHRHNLQNEALRVHGWQAYWDGFFAEEEVFYGHVLGFKGLERPVVVLAVDGFKQPQRAKEMLYVGLSRARTQLVVCGNLAEIAAVGGEGVRRRLVDAEQWSP